MSEVDNVATVSGYAGLEDCINYQTGVCAQNCGYQCNGNLLICTWPNFNECTGAPNCRDNTKVPFHSGKCSDLLTFTCPCNGAQIYPQLSDCGPPAHNCAGGFCPHGTQPVICCINTQAFTNLCNFCNPNTYGIIYIKATV